MLHNFIDAIALSKQMCEIPIQGMLKYATDDNFLGRIVDGYQPALIDIGLLTREAAKALCQAQHYFLTEYGYSLRIYDAYRPLRAIKDFQRWIDEPIITEQQQAQKQLYFPHLEKADLIKLGYIATGESSIISRHCYGNAVDVALIDLATNQELSMGAIFDFFDEISHTTASIAQIGEQAWQHRQILQTGMTNVGFHPYQEEYWHFDYHKREIDNPEDIPITEALRGIGC